MTFLFGMVSEFTWPVGNVVFRDQPNEFGDRKGHEVEIPGGLFSIHLIHGQNLLVFKGRIRENAEKNESLVSWILHQETRSMIDCFIILPAGCGDGGNGKTIKTAWQDGPLLYTCSYKLYFINGVISPRYMGLRNKWVTACGYFTP